MDQYARLRGMVERTKTMELCPRYTEVRMRGNRERSRVRRATDPAFKMLCLLRNRARCALVARGVKKHTRTEKMLGCSIPFFLGYITGRFLPGMTIANHGEWELDHIRPCRSFDLADPAQQAQCFHWSNFQPLWKTDNRQKSGKWVVT